jgi:hypothetical protein
MTHEQRIAVLRARLASTDRGGVGVPALHGVSTGGRGSAAVAGEDLREFFEERAGILEHDAGLLRPEAEFGAAKLTATLARNRGYLWASLRVALSGYPALSPQVPDRAATVDSLPFGMASVHVREGAKPGPVSGNVVIAKAEIEAARKGRRAVRQGAFGGGQEVKA